MTDPNGTYTVSSGEYVPGPVPPWPLTPEQEAEVAAVAAATWPPPAEVLDPPEDASDGR